MRDAEFKLKMDQSILRISYQHYRMKEALENIVAGREATGPFRTLEGVQRYAAAILAICEEKDA